MGYSPWDCKESDVTQQLSVHGGPVDKTPGSKCREPGFDPWSSNQIPQPQLRVHMPQQQIPHASKKVRKILHATTKTQCSQVNVCAQSCRIYAAPWTQPARPLCPCNSPGKNTGWLAISSSRGSSRDQTCVPVIAYTGRRILQYCVTWDCFIKHTHTHTHTHTSRSLITKLEYTLKFQRKQIQGKARIKLRR